MKHITQLRVLFAGEPIGLLKWHNRQYWFQHDAYWLQHGFNLAPQFINFNNEPQLAKHPTFQGLHGVFYDSLPDGWGMLLMDRFFKRKFGWDIQEITPLDRLAYIGNRGMGALEYLPVIADDEISETINLAKLVENSEKIITGNSRVVLDQLRILGGSPAGARPKVTAALADKSDDCIAGIADLPAGFNHYLIKFHGQNDLSDIGRIEKAYSELAKNAGLKVPASRLISVTCNRKRQDLFAVQRFDREKQIKHHLLTLASYLYADFRTPAVDYQALLTATLLLTDDIREVEQAFRLMVFNVVMHNKDDHAKNFSFLCNRQGRWQLAPAYDLTFSHGYNNEHTTAINGSGNPSRKDLQVLAEIVGIKNWINIADEVLDAAEDWETIAKKYKVTQSSTSRVAKQVYENMRRLKR